MSVILTIEKLTKRFNNNNQSLKVLEDLSFTVDRGEFLSIVGPSGCGKSTLLGLLAGFDKEFSGKMFINEQEILGPKLDRIMVFQDFNQLFPWKTLLENVIFPLKINNIGDKHKLRKEIAKEFLTMVRLEEYLEYYPHQLSGGMKQRAAIARALALNPDVLLMDEPFGSLDIHIKEELQDMLLRLWEDSKSTIIFVTHDINEAVKMSDRILIMSNCPSNIKKIVENNIKRPREPLDIEFISKVKKISDILKTRS